MTEKLFDVQRLISETSVEELNRLADEYFSNLTDRNYHLAKPFGSIEEVPKLLNSFAVVLQGLSLCQGMTVLEFGAGTCWATRFLTQLGCSVIALDVSPAALDIGRELYERQPVFGAKPVPQFLVFDGRRIQLPDSSVDRIICLDAFHHVANQQEVLRELGRVLRDGGIAGFAEPGPEHSLSPMSQYEMNSYKVVERDVDIGEIWRLAKGTGFTDMKLAVFNTDPFLLPIDDFQELADRQEAFARYAEATREFLKEHRTFFLHKGEPRPLDSRSRAGLVAKIAIRPASLTIAVGDTIRLEATVQNTSGSVWLPVSAGLGAVMLGCHVYHQSGEAFKKSYHWESLTPEDGKEIFPGETVEFQVNLPSLPAGSYILEFDMVSNEVCWFALNGSPTVRINVRVV